MRTLTRVVLAISAVVSLELAAWGLLSPHGFYDNYPGGGRHWVIGYPPFNEHLTRDYAAAMLAVGVLAVWALVTMDRRLIQAALLMIGLATLPHAIFHSATSDQFPTATDRAMSLGGLWLGTVFPLALLLYSIRAGRTQTAPSL
jgi:hypothetical protein